MRARWTDRLVALALLFVSSASLAQNNSWQSFQPFRNNYVARTGSSYSETNSDPNVVALWKFNEASGNIVDTISGVTLTASGSPTYSVVSSGAFAGITPGISLTTGDSFIKTTDTASMDFGTSDFTIEIYYLSTDAAGSRYMFDTRHAVSGRGYYGILTNANANLNFALVAEDDTTSDVNLGISATLDDGVMHKFRITGDRDGNAVLKIDGVIQASASIAATNGKTVSAHRVALGSSNNGGSSIKATLSTFRLSRNLTANLGGPGGG